MKGVDQAMQIYLDTSVLVSVYIPEKHSKSILDVLHDTKERPMVSRLAETEFYAALASKIRTKELSTSAVKTAISMFRHHIATLIYENVYITDSVFTTAMDFLSQRTTNLRTLDALHLACSHIINAKIVTADKILAKSAEQLNIPVKLLLS